jgi:hypothetical protein
MLVKFSVWLEDREHDSAWKSEEVKADYEAWSDEVRGRFSKVKMPSPALSRFMDGFIKSVEHCSKSIPSFPGAFGELCLSKRKEMFAREVRRGSFESDLSRPSGTWADGLTPPELGFSYFVLFGERIPRPAWLDSHEGINYTPHSRRVRRPGTEHLPHSYTHYDTEYYNADTGKYEPGR